MFDALLFLGFPLSPAFQQELLRVSSVERELFIQEGGVSGELDPSPYLQIITYEEREYLGKTLGSIIELNDLEQFCSHLYSLLKKMVPQCSFDRHSLVLLALYK